MKELAPTIINVPALPPEQTADGRPRLRGLHVTDADTIGHALQVLGVHDQELPNWTLHTGRTEGASGPTDVMFDIPKITETIEYHARRNRVANSEMYRKLVGPIVFLELYNQSPIRSRLYETIASDAMPGRINTILPVLAAVSVGYAEQGAQGGLMAGVVAMGLQSIYMMHSPKMRYTRAEKKLLKQLQTENPALENQLGAVTLPVYFSS